MEQCYCLSCRYLKRDDGFDTCWKCHEDEVKQNHIRLNLIGLKMFQYKTNKN